MSERSELQQHGVEMQTEAADGWVIGGLFRAPDEVVGDAPAAVLVRKNRAHR